MGGERIRWECQSALVEGKPWQTDIEFPLPASPFPESLLTVMGPSPPLKAPRPLLPFWVKSIPAQPSFGTHTALHPNPEPVLVPPTSMPFSFIGHMDNSSYPSCRAPGHHLWGASRNHHASSFLVCHQVLLIPMSGCRGQGAGDNRGRGSVCFHTCSCYYPLGF